MTDSPETGVAASRYDVEHIYEQTRRTICAYVLYLGVPEAQAPEVTQEVYLRLHQTIRKGDEIVNLRAWLFRVAHNLALKARPRKKSSLSLHPDWEQLPDHASLSPERMILDHEKMQQVRAALEILSPQQRNCLYLRSEGLRYREIAEVMGISSSTVNEFLRRAIARLAEAVHA